MRIPLRRTLALLAIFVIPATSMTGQEPSSFSEATGKFYYVPNPDLEHRIKIRSNDGLVSELRVPSGVVLCIEANKEQNPRLNEPEAAMDEFKGEIVLRVRRKGNDWKGVELAQKVFEDPVEMHLKNCIVSVEHSMQSLFDSPLGAK